MIDRKALTDRIREVVNCHCCPIDEAAIESIVAYFLDGLDYTETELTFEKIDNEADLLYNYIVFTNGWAHAAKVQS